MKTNHTPGPWKFHLGRGANPRLHIQTSAGYQIASTPEVSRNGDESSSQEANAALIAASPDLLLALEAILKANDFAALFPYEDFRIVASEKFGKAIAQARAAIAKATQI